MTCGRLLMWRHLSATVAGLQGASREVVGGGPDSSDRGYAVSQFMELESSGVGRVPVRGGASRSVLISLIGTRTHGGYEVW